MTARADFRLLLEAMQRRANILVIDDDPLIPQIIEIDLGGGVEVASAQTVDEAIAKVVQANEDPLCYPFDLFFVDLVMRPKDGIEFVRWAKRNAPDTPLAIISGYPFSELACRAVCEGYVGLVTKPFGRGAIREVLRKHRIPVFAQDRRECAAA